MFGSLILLAVIIPLAIAVAAPFIEDGIREYIKTNGTSSFWAAFWWWGLFIIAVVAGLAILVLLTLSFALHAWRRAVWENIDRFFAWGGELRIMSAAQRAALGQEGYDRRSVEVKKERTSSAQPTWRFDVKDSFGMPNAIFLTNHGYSVSDVEVTWDESEFTGFGEASFAGPMSPGTGKWFEGVPTGKGLEEGVTFHVSWRDQRGDAFERDVLMPSEDIRSAHENLLRKRHSEGVKEGYQRGLQDHAETVLMSVPPPAPRWSISWGAGSWTADGGTMEVILRNAMPDSTAHGVRIDSMDANSSVVDAGYWQQMHGEGNRMFKVRVHAGGVNQECRFRLTWRDHNGDEMAEPLLLTGLANQNLPRASEDEEPGDEDPT